MKLVVLGLVFGGLVTTAAAQTGPGSGTLASRACTLFAPRAELADPVLVDAYNAQAHAIRSLFVSAMVTAGSSNEAQAKGSQTRPLPALIQVVKPDLIRVTGPSRLSGDRGFEMASDGREFHLLIPEDGKKVFLAGPPDAALQSKDMRENVRPQPFFDALLWQEGSLLSSPVRLTAGEARQIRLELPPGRNGARSATIDFDVANGVIRSLSVFDSSGKMLFRAEYKRWEEIETLSRQPQRGCFPREIHLVRPGDDLFLDLHITQMDLNPEIPRSSFRMSTPKNIPVIYVDESGKTATRP